jgi:transcriptional regulator with PAS, ATPase and Fis domain
MSSPTVLLFGRSIDTRRRLASLLAPELHVQEFEIADLEHPGYLIDAVAAVVLLEGEDGPEAISSLRPLLLLPAGEQVVLVVDQAPDAAVELALAELQPAQVLSYPMSAPVLRFAMGRVLPDFSPGAGARPEQRRVPALLGISRAIRDVLERVKRVGPSGVPVLILGETGTGKELVAHAIHDQSGRRGGPCVTVNCGALPDTLLESELFGHRRGAFTGAESDKRGLFEEADGGTLFLDEIADTSTVLQGKLLRALEDGEVRPRGDTVARRVDVRLISATHRDLEREVKEGRFRRDLYYRINTVSIHVPSLRRRRADIPFLAQHFAEEFGVERAREITLGEDFLEKLCRYDFPGNVHELRNAVERAIALAAPEERITATALDLAGVAAQRQSALSATGTLWERVGQLEIELIRDALARFEGNRTRVAEALGLSRLGLRKKMLRLGLEEVP